MMEGYDGIKTNKLVLKRHKKSNKKEKKKKRKNKRKKEDDEHQRSCDGESESIVVKTKRVKKLHQEQQQEEVEEEELSHLTPAQRKFELSKRKREKEQIQKMISKTHREKIDEFNQKLAKMTDHNDIPRVSAAGNG